MCHVSCVTRHVSRVTCHVSPVICQNIYLFLHFSFTLKQIGQRGGASCRRVCYQRGLPRLVLYCKPYAIIGSEILKFEPGQKKPWTMQLKKTQIQDSRTCDKIAKNYFSLVISWILEQTVAVFKSPRVHGTNVIYLVLELLELLKFSALEPLPH